MRGGFFQPWEIDVHPERLAEHGVRAWHAIAPYEQRSPCLTLGLATMISMPSPCMGLAGAVSCKDRHA
jgi:hypothetical protein